MDNKNLSNQIGKRIRSLRELRELTREEFVEKADISVQFLAEIETGKKNMSTNSLYKVAKALNVSCDYIVFGTENKTNLTEINELLSSLSQDKLKHAHDMLIIFINALDD